jgi:hypothetical protein
VSAPTELLPEQLAELFHETYERLAPSYGYRTRKESAKPWSEVPKENKTLMIAVCAVILHEFSAKIEPCWKCGATKEIK